MIKILSLITALFLASGMTSVTMPFRANPTTGYSWYGEVVMGDSVELEDAYGSYVSDPAPDDLCGVGGTTYYKVNARRQGRSVLSFVYERPWEGGEEPELYLAEVAGKGLTVSALSGGSEVRGVVQSVDEAARAAVLEDGTGLGFEEGLPLPVKAQGIRAYTRDGSAVVLWQDCPACAMSGAELFCGRLVGIEYSCSGNELGNLFSACIGPAEDGSLRLTVEESEEHSLPVDGSTYSAADDVLERIAKVVRENGMEAWEDREDVMFVCDAAQPYIILEVEDADGRRETVSINGFIEFSRSESEAYHQVYDLIFESRRDANLLEKFTRERD